MLCVNVSFMLFYVVILLQESCARVLLFRGADKNLQNFANQDAYQLAIISGNFELANIIENFSPSEVGESFAMFLLLMILHFFKPYHYEHL